MCVRCIYAFRLLMVYKSRAFFFCLVFFLVLYYYNLVFNVFGLVSSFTRFKYLVRGYIKYILYKRSKKKKTRKKKCVAVCCCFNNIHIYIERHINNNIQLFIDICCEYEPFLQYIMI